MALELVGPKITHHTGGHTDNATQPAFDMMDKVFDDPRFGLNNQEVTINYGGRDKGHSAREPYSVYKVDAPPSATVTIICQPTGNDTCAKYKVVVAGWSAAELAERLDNFRQYIQRDKGNWYIVPEAAEVVENREYTIAPKEKKDVKPFYEASEEEMARRVDAAMRVKTVSKEIRQRLLETIRAAGPDGTTGKSLVPIVREYPEAETSSVGVMVTPLLNKGLIIKPTRQRYIAVETEDFKFGDPISLLTTVVSAEQPLPLTKTQRVKQAVVDFLNTRPQGAVREHLRQRASTALGEAVNGAMMVKVVRELQVAGIINRTRRGRYELNRSADPDVLKRYLEPEPEPDVQPEPEPEVQPEPELTGPSSPWPLEVSGPSSAWPAPVEEVEESPDDGVVDADQPILALNDRPTMYDLLTAATQDRATKRAISDGFRTAFFPPKERRDSRKVPVPEPEDDDPMADLLTSLGSMLTAIGTLLKKS